MSIEEQHYKWEATPEVRGIEQLSEETISYLLFIFLLQVTPLYTWISYLQHLLSRDRHRSRYHGWRRPPPCADASTEDETQIDGVASG
jgi:hypothetical protein